MSRTSFNLPKKQSLIESYKSKSIRGRVAAIAMAAGAVGLVGTTAYTAYELDKDNQRSIQINAAEIAQHEILAHDSAISQASIYTQSLNKGQRVPMQVLNGTVETPVTSGKIIHPNNYKNPILLAQLDPNQKPEANGDFLAGSWLGIQSNDAQGNVVITVVPFEGKAVNQTFVANNPDEVIFPRIDVYAQAGKGGDNISQLYAFDPTKNVTLPDTPVGNSFGMK